jgi:hypothetical protein
MIAMADKKRDAMARNFNTVQSDYDTVLARPVGMLKLR